MNPTDPQSPDRELLAECQVMHDGSVLRLELVKSRSGRPPSLCVSRRTSEGRGYSVIISPMFRADVLEAVRQWDALVEAHEARGGPTSPRTGGAANGVPGASSRNGGAL